MVKPCVLKLSPGVPQTNGPIDAYRPLLLSLFPINFFPLYHIKTNLVIFPVWLVSYCVSEFFVIVVPEIVKKAMRTRVVVSV